MNIQKKTSWALEKFIYLAKVSRINFLLLKK